MYSKQTKLFNNYYELILVDLFRFNQWWQWALHNALLLTNPPSTPTTNGPNYHAYYPLSYTCTCKTSVTDRIRMRSAINCNIILRHAWNKGVVLHLIIYSVYAQCSGVLAYASWDMWEAQRNWWVYVRWLFDLSDSLSFVSSPQFSV